MPLPSRSTIARGGKAIYGAPLGILMLDARFPRIPGDMGNATTWPFPVLYRVVRGASPEKVVLQGARGLLPDFIDAAQDLVRLGAEAITTNCGFLSLFQRELAAAVGVPVARTASTSSACSPGSVRSTESHPSPDVPRPKSPARSPTASTATSAS